MFGLEGMLLRAVKSFNVNNRTCVRVGNGLNEWFLAKVRLHHECFRGCSMYIWMAL